MRRYRKFKSYKNKNSNIVGGLILLLFFIYMIFNYISKNLLLFIPLIILCVFTYIIYYKSKNLINDYEYEFAYIDNMSGIEFENFLAKVFRNKGYRVDPTPVTGDYGADLILKLKDDRICVQVKRCNDKIGVKAVQEVLGSLSYYGANKGMVITNNYFTPNAIKLSRVNKIDLVDRNCLIKIFNEIQSKNNTNGAVT